jgi:hypothetical protein
MVVKKVTAPKPAPTIKKDGESSSEASSSGEEESSEEEESKVHDMTMESKKSKRKNKPSYSTTPTVKELDPI